MKVLIFLAMVVLMLVQNRVSSGQIKPTVGNILQQLQFNYQSIENGKYEILYKIKHFDRQDTAERFGEVRFEKSLYNSQTIAKYQLKTPLRLAIYTIDKAIEIDSFDSIGVVYDFEKIGFWYSEQMQNNDLLFKPFTSETHFIKEIYNDFFGKEPTISLKIQGEEVILGEKCYKIEIIYPLNAADAIDEHKDYLWVDVKNYLPKKHVSTLLFQSQVQYIEVLLKNIELNNQNTKIADINAEKQIPKNFKTSVFLPQNEMQLLPNGTIAPPFEHTTTQGEPITINNPDFDLTLLFFWHTNSYNSIKDLATIEKIHQKYVDLGLKVIGMNVFDEDQQYLKDFLATKKISHQNALKAYKTSQVYQVTTFPSYYLIDKDGKIVASILGNNPQRTQLIDNLIRGLLN